MSTQDSPTGFLEAWARLVGPRGVPKVATRRGRKPRVPFTQVLPALTFHVMQDAGTLAEHLFQLFRTPLADSSWSDRRLRLPWEIFAELMRRALRPRATPRQHREAFWRGWRLVALDGTQFSLINTPQITATFDEGPYAPGPGGLRQDHDRRPVGNRAAQSAGRGGRLQGRIGMGAGAATAGAAAEAGVAAGRSLVWRRRVCVGRACRVPARRQSLLAAGLPVGQAAHDHATARWQSVGRPPVRAPRNPTRIVAWLEVREIRVRVGRKGQRAHELRLWTTLLDPRTAPALELARVYASRWEHELYFREIKRQLRRTALLQSHTVETGAQEIAAIVLASAVIADERARVATGHIPALRVSFGQVLDIVRGMWLFLGPFDDVFTDQQKTRVVRRGHALMRRSVPAPRRPRTCPRAVRQPVTKWPRLLKPQSIEAPWELQLV